MSVVPLVLNVLGVIFLLRWAHYFCSFMRPFVLPSSIGRFLRSADAYALITGASDGIGKEIARELYHRGFNLILHGRNEGKLWKTAEDIRMGQGPKKDIKVWVADATDPDINYTSVVEEWRYLNISLVIHNVSPHAPRAETIDGIPEHESLKDIRCGIHFPFLLTRALLPKLRTTPGPVEIVFMGTFGGGYSMPRLTAALPAKMFLRQFSLNIVADERFPGPTSAEGSRPTNISCMYVLVGSVVSAGHPAQKSLVSPSARTFARATVNCIGCGRDFIAPYLPHAVGFGLAGLLSGGVREALFLRGIQKQLALVAKQD